MSTLIIIGIIVAFVAEQVAYRFFLPYPFKYGLLVYQRNNDIPEISLWRGHTSRLNLRQRLTRLTSTLIFEKKSLPDEVNFYSFIYGRIFMPVVFLIPIIFTCQIRQNEKKNSILQIRIGYMMALAVTYIFVTSIASATLQDTFWAVAFLVFIAAHLLTSVRAFDRYKKIVT